MATNRFFRRLAQVLRETADLGAQSWHYEVSEPAGRPPWNSPPRVRAVTAASSGGLPPPLPTKGRPFASAPTATALAAVTNRALGAGVTDSHRPRDENPSGTRVPVTASGVGGDDPAPCRPGRRPSRCRSASSGAAVWNMADHKADPVRAQADHQHPEATGPPATHQRHRRLDSDPAAQDLGPTKRLQVGTADQRPTSRPGHRRRPWPSWRRAAPPKALARVAGRMGRRPDALSRSASWSTR